MLASAVVKWDTGPETVPALLMAGASVAALPLVQDMVAVATALHPEGVAVLLPEGVAVLLLAGATVLHPEGVAVLLLADVTAPRPEDATLPHRGKKSPFAPQDAPPRPGAVLPRPSAQLNAAHQTGSTRAALLLESAPLFHPATVLHPNAEGQAPRPAPVPMTDVPLHQVPTTLPTLHLSDATTRTAEAQCLVPGYIFCEMPVKNRDCVVVLVIG